MELIPRSRWGARYRAGFGPRALPTSQAWLHHSVTLAPDLAFADLDGDGVDEDEERAMRAIESIGQQRFGAGFSYNVALMPSGRLYEGCGVARVGAHTQGRNTTAFGLVLVGDYSARDLPAPMRAALPAVLRHAAAARWIDAPRFDGGHRDLKNTGCPGDYAYRIIGKVNDEAARPAAPSTPTGTDDDMATIGPGSDQAAVKLLQACLVEEARASNRDSPANPERAGLGWVDGVYGDETEAAVDAYRGGKVLGAPAKGCDGVTLALLLRYEP